MKKLKKDNRVEGKSKQTNLENWEGNDDLTWGENGLGED